MSDTTHPLFPCWGQHSRMGHNVIVGRFEAMPGSTTAICVTPALDADPERFRIGTPEDVQVVPMDGPAFFGFRVLSEDAARRILRDSQPIDWDARNAAKGIRQITDTSDLADEIDDEREDF